jgi:short-subunit dehydrogenase
MYLIYLNIGAMVDMTYQALHIRIPSERFTLVNVTSLASFPPMPYKAVYSSTKRFIINFALALWKEIESFGNVTILYPAGLPTNAESMKKIFLQGFWGKMTAQDTSLVVRKTIEKMEKTSPFTSLGCPITS